MTVEEPEEKQVDLDAAAALTNPDLDIAAFLHALHDHHAATRSIDVGYPVATDIDYSPLDGLAGSFWNNIGDPHTDPQGGNHTKPAERALLDWAGDLFGFPIEDRWGYVTTGGTEGNHAGLHTARNSFPTDEHGRTTAVTYYSAAAHYSVPKILEFLGMPGVRVRTDEQGEMDYHHLDQLVAERPGKPAIVTATVGTTMTEAIDNVTRIDAILTAHQIHDRYVHVDAALTGIPLALDSMLRLERTDSIAVSGYKFFGTKRICGLVLGRRHTRRRGQHIAYTATLDSTFTGSRDGIGALQMWYAVALHGNEGHRSRVRAARDLAAYATRRLNEVGWPAWRHPWAMTVVFPTPPSAVINKWKLANADGLSHLMCMPGRTTTQIDDLAADIANARHPAAPAAVPLPRISSERLPACS